LWKEVIMRKGSKKRLDAIRNAIEPLESRTMLSTSILVASEDTYVRPGATTAGTNFNEAAGSCSLPLTGNSCLVVRNDNGTSSGALARITYLKFNTSGVSGDVHSAVLRLYGAPANGTESPAGAKNDEAHGVLDTSWTETTLTYNNRPVPDATVLSTASIPGPPPNQTVKPYTWDVSVWAAAHPGAAMSFAIQEATQGALSHFYRSHEWTTDSERPRLLLSAGAPNAPQNLTFTPGNGQIVLNWSNLEPDGDVSDATSWSVYRGTSSGGEVLLVNNLTTTTYTDAALANGQSYFYYVVATNASGDSPISNEVGPAQPLFTAPAPITVTEGIGTIQLDWPAVAFADTYRVYRSDTSGGTFVLQTDQAPTTFVDNVPAGSKWYYQVSAVRAGVESSRSPEIPATAGIIGAGTGLSATYYDNQDFTIPLVTRVDPTINFDWDACCNWTNVTPPDGSPDPLIGPNQYSARWLGDVQAEYTQPTTFYTRTDDGVRLWINDKLVIDAWIDQGATTWVSAPVNLVAGQKYHLRMDFYENGGASNAILSWSSPSIPVEVIPQSQLFEYDNVPRLAAAPSVVSANVVDSANVCVQWTDVAYDEDSFIVQRSTSPTFATTVNIPLAAVPNVGNCLDSTVTASTAYYYRVAARNAVGDSVYTIANQRNITNLVRASNVTTVTVAAAHGLAVGNSVTITGASGAGFNGTFTVASVPTATTFTVANAGANETATVFGSYYTPVIPTGSAVVNFPSFPASTPDLKFVGNGFGLGPQLTGGRLRLVDAVDSAAGGAWTSNVKVIDTFISSFDLQITNSNGADGMMFVIQANGNNTLGGAGGGLGFAGMPRSVGIKFDFYDNINQVGVYANGAMNDTVGTTLNTGYNVSGGGIDFDRTNSGVAGGNGNIFHVDVAYDGAMLVWSITDTTDRSKIFSGNLAIDIAGIIGSHCAWVGFTAANGGLHATQEIVKFAFTNVGPVVNGTTNADQFYIKLNAPGGNRINVWNNHNPAVDPPDVDLALTAVQNLTLSGGQGVDTYTIDFVNGNPVPVNGFVLDGGMHNDLLVVKGTSAAETFSINGTTVTVPGGRTFRATALDGGSFDLGQNVAGDPDDVLNITNSVGFSPALNGGGGNNTINIASSTYTASTDALPGNNDGAGHPTLTMNATGTTVISAIATQHLKTLSLSDTSRFNLTSFGNKLLRTGTLSLASGAILDVGDGDVIADSTAANRMSNLNALLAALKSGRAGGAWNGNGIRSAAAASNGLHTTTVGIFLNDTGSGSPILASFNGEVVDANATLLKYTYYGDRNFDGKLDADDYTGMDGGFANRNDPNNLVFPRQPWRDGDPNLSGTVNFDDYFSMDLAFSNQPTILSSTADPTPMPASSTSVSKATTKAKAKAKHRKVTHHNRVLMFRVRD
jgi:hypothetical protein